ncbi:MAG: hypothetical protein WDO71_14630 [Bacteroidota bacterium]
MSSIWFFKVSHNLAEYVKVMSKELKMMWGGMKFIKEMQHRPSPVIATTNKVKWEAKERDKRVSSGKTIK